MPGPLFNSLIYFSESPRCLFAQSRFFRKKLCWLHSSAVHVSLPSFRCAQKDV